MQKGEVVLFLRGSLKKHKRENAARASHAKDIEAAPTKEKVEMKDHLDSQKYSSDRSSSEFVPETGNIFHWRNLTYEVKIKSETRVILNHVDGWVKPGQLTALMGSSGAGKTTLLNCLSERVTTGVISDGTRMVNGHSLDSSFQRSIGYVQQQDLHLPSSTVREALQFSAYLRQPNSVSKAEKSEYVEYIIDLLDMTTYADALVGVAGEGLNVEQRKRLTIGVELVAKPKLLLFLDEPTSGLDSQTAWSICQLMRKLADRGQAILCTIHQPSAILLKEFDRLLFLQKGGQTVYFGDLGENCSTLIDYFEKYGADPCPKEANPAEWMLQVVGAAPGSHAKQDYHEVWRNSTEFQEVNSELDRMEAELSKLPRDDSPESRKSYAAPFWTQYWYVTSRVIVQKWRSPGYIYSKILLAVFAALFNGFSFFKANNTIQGLQNQMFAVFLYTIPFNTLIQQMLPYFVQQRELYEVREAASKSFGWLAFITAQITSEIPYQIIVGTLAFFSWYYPVGLYQNATVTDAVHERGALMWLFFSAFFVYTSTMGQLCISFIELVENAANLSMILFTLCLNFSGIVATPEAMPHFWIFMYRCNPFTYFFQGVLSAGLANSAVECLKNEILKFKPTQGSSCGDYLADYMKQAGGYLVDPSQRSVCEYCPMSSTNDFLGSVHALYSERWRNFGIFVCFIAANILLTTFLYWLARVPKRNRERKLQQK
jgi:ATP-binding cassette subfamily G (WHITE) protein 2 (PDR)